MGELSPEQNTGSKEWANQSNELAKRVENGVPLAEVLEHVGSAIVELGLNTGSGIIEMVYTIDRRAWHVRQSSDPSIQAGDFISLAGATLNGGSYMPALAPGARLGFTKYHFKRYSLGETDSEERGTVRSEVFNGLQKHGIARLLDDGQIEVRVPDPAIRATDFVSRAFLTEITDQGKTERQLFSSQ